MSTPLSDFTYEQELKRDYPSTLFLGVDEAGRGPLAGPVVAAVACYKRSDFFLPEGLEKEFAFIRDSKTLSEKKREEMFVLISEHFDIGVGIIYPETIDRVNILQATFLAMKEAVGDVQRKQRSLDCTRDDKNILLLIDGNQKIPNLSLAQETVVSGDKLVKSIAAASIIAKVTRDRIMNDYDAQYPQYGFKKHKGYGTKMHMEALKTYGPTPIHRISFAPVAQSVMWFKELGIIPD
jgi:ribonuclease HII